MGRWPKAARRRIWPSKPRPAGCKSAGACHALSDNCSQCSRNPRARWFGWRKVDRFQTKAQATRAIAEARGQGQTRGRHVYHRLRRGGSDASYTKRELRYLKAKGGPK